MGIRFAQFAENNRKYLYGFWATVVLGGLSAVTTSPNGFGLAQVLLAAAFVLLIAYASSQINDDYRKQDFLGSELTADEYLALGARLERYPDLRAKVRELLPDSGKVTYEDAERIEQIVNSHVPLGSQTEKEALEQHRSALYRGVKQ
jgi:hypothetical protein